MYMQNLLKEHEKVNKSTIYERKEGNKISVFTFSLEIVNQRFSHI